MKKFIAFSFILCLGISTYAQDSTAQEEFVKTIKDEVYHHSTIKENAHELFDDIGPRLAGSPEMQKARDWIVSKYKSWGIDAENEQWGKWKKWQRGITHIDMTSPRTQTLAGTQLAWSPGTSDEGVTAEVITLPEDIKDSTAFQEWLPHVKDKFVMVSMKEPTGRPDDNWEEWATDASFKSMKEEREDQKKAWKENLEKTGYATGFRNNELIPALEEAGAVGIIQNYWSQGFGTDKIFFANTKDIPTVDIQLEDYTMLYRMAEHGDQPEIHVVAKSEDLGESPTFNTVAKIEGTEKPDEYVVLSAHFDSWDGATGATDNGTGTLMMMETMRLLKKYYPKPKRTIIAGHWGAEEEGLNGSASFVEDHPEIVDNIQAVFNQDNGTGRVEKINGSGFLHSYDYISRWLTAVPDTVSQHIETNFPGMPASGGTDHASFVRAGAPAFNLSSLSWSYWDYTWHTNRDTYDKIIWPDLKNNIILSTILAYMASEDPEKTSDEKRVLPLDEKTGEPEEWPEPHEPKRKGRL